MKYIATCIEGLEEITEKETKGKTLLPGRILFEKLKPLRSALQIYELVKQLKFKDLEDIKVKLPKQTTFAVRCKLQGEHKFNSKQVEHQVGKDIEGKVNLTNPETTIIVDIINNDCLIGILKHKDLQKREYRIKTNPFTINTTIAYALTQLANIKKDETILDPYCKEGTIVIEAALTTKAKIIGSDPMLNNIKSSKINAKLANVNIEFSKLDIDWLETRYPKITKIITSITKNTNVKELFKQADIILKDTITILTKKPITPTNFKLIKELKIKNYYIQQFKKNI